MKFPVRKWLENLTLVFKKDQRIVSHCSLKLPGKFIRIRFRAQTKFKTGNKMSSNDSKKEILAYKTMMILRSSDYKKWSQFGHNRV
jgi:hypothetical protein